MLSYVQKADFEKLEYLKFYNWAFIVLFYFKFLIYEIMCIKIFS